MGRILDTISSPQDLKGLSNEQLQVLAGEIRRQIVETTSRNGGHVAPSLGAVDFIVALHSLMDCPKDKIVFDVGHQAYAHKLLTGRRDQFDTLRQYQGISGFPKPMESPYDVHPSGHASDSLSVAYGLAKARDLRGSDERIVAVIGDAAIGGGMAFEALNQIGQDETPMVIILNDNEMSISRNVGALMHHFGRLRASNEYRARKDQLQKEMESHGPVGRGMLWWGKSAKESVKQFFLSNAMLYEQMGIMCSSPIDGHNISLLREILGFALQAKGPVMLHVVTKKGYGYGPALREPEKFHGISPYDIATGTVIAKPSRAPKYMNVFGDAIVKEAQANPDVVAITAAMKSGTGLTKFAELFPDRFVDVGIAEEHAVGMASGLAIGGKKPVVAIYSTFLQRAIDQMAIDVCFPNLDVVFCADRAGLVGDDGPTHHGVFDLVYARMIPHMKVLTPGNEADLVNGLHTALALGGPFFIRYPRGEAVGVPVPDKPVVLEPGVSRLMQEGEQAALLAFGNTLCTAMAAADMLRRQDISVRVVDMIWAKPLDEDAIVKAAETGLVVTLEEGVITGGVGEGVLEVLSRHCLTPATMTFGLPDYFVPQGNVGNLLADKGLDPATIADAIARRLAQ